MCRNIVGLTCSVILVFSSLAFGQPPAPLPCDPPGRDSVADWNAIALNAVATDFSSVYGSPDQPGPVYTARALAIIHLAMFDAANMIITTSTPYLAAHTPTTQRNVSLDAAVAQAAADTLTALYPKQASVFSAALTAYFVPLKSAVAKNNGIQIGHTVASDILYVRSLDGSNFSGSYTPSGAAGNHDVDPLNPEQGFYAPAFGQVEPFSPAASFHYTPTPPPALGSDAYTAAFNDVKSLGGDGVNTSTTRTPEQTQIGLFWAYDGANKIGVPPRMYNQIARVIAANQKNTEVQNARYFALVNAAMADAGIQCWGSKYYFAFWRPILGIRRAVEDGNDATVADTSWTPLCSPASNSIGKLNFTPPFPAYQSGHATFCAAMFRTLQNYYGTDEIPFTFVSDELNGITTDNAGNVRPYSPRSFAKLSDAALENARSRIYLGIHWQFDADEGIRAGTAIGDHVYTTILQPK